MSDIEKAIEILKKHYMTSSEVMNKQTAEENNEAVDMAIEALKKWEG